MCLVHPLACFDIHEKFYILEGFNEPEDIVTILMNVVYLYYMI